MSVAARVLEAPPNYTPRLKLSEVLVTPDMALHWLTECNNHNRQLRDPRVAVLTAKLSAIKSWKHTGESIIFDRNGQLLDGQHRLQAVFNAGVAAWFVVVEGVEPEAFSHIDTGAKRTTADVLHIAGYRSTTTLGAAARLCIHLERIESDQLPFLRLGGHGPGSEEVLAWVNDHPELARYVRLPPNPTPGESVWNPPALFRALYWRLGQVDSEHATTFFARLADGVGLAGEDPILLLRGLLLEERGKVRRRGGRPHWYKAAMTIKAWNAYREGRPMKHLRFQTGGIAPDAWPVPV